MRGAEECERPLQKPLALFKTVWERVVLGEKECKMEKERETAEEQGK